MWRDHDDANVAEILLQHLFGLGTDVDRRHVHEHSKVLLFVHHSLHLREQLPQSFRGRSNDGESRSSGRLWPNRAPHAQ